MTLGMVLKVDVVDLLIHKTHGKLSLLNINNTEKIYLVSAQNLISCIYV